MKRIFAVFCFVLITPYGFSQSVYTYDIKRDLVIGFLSIGLSASRFFVNNEPGQIPVLLE
jgi:hypothetical protein